MVGWVPVGGGVDTCRWFRICRCRGVPVGGVGFVDVGWVPVGGVGTCLGFVDVGGGYL